MSGRSIVVAVAVLLLLGTWAVVVAVLSGLVHGLPRRLRAPRRRTSSRATNRADRAFARTHGVSAPNRRRGRH